jgi:hypothetical protein
MITQFVGFISRSTVTVNYLDHEGDDMPYPETSRVYIQLPQACFKLCMTDTRIIRICA